MAGKVATLRVLVDGMSCSSCEQRIEKGVGAIHGVSRVKASASLGEVMVYYDPVITGPSALHEAVRKAGYTVRDEQPGAPVRPEQADRGAPSWTRFLGLLAIVAAVYFILKYAGGFTFLPTVSQSMGYGLLFVVGLLTSLHCVAMCGGIVLSQGIRKEAAGPVPATGAPRLRPVERLLPSLLYNGGRVVSYTIIGGIVGALGSLFSLSTALRGAMPVVAGAFMLFLGVRMLGIFPWLSRLKVRFPGIGGAKMRAAAAGRGPFVVGLLNGLMPCGPLQTMQVYALGTGSFFAGALSMFLFSLGTVPLLLGFGAISSLLSARFNRGMVKASGVLVAVLGLVMFARGMNLFGVALPGVPLVLAAGVSTAAPSQVAVAKVSGDFQEVSTTVESGQYHPFLVQKGIPVRWTISVKADDLNGCNNPVTIPPYGIRKLLVPGENLVEFTPDREGTIVYTCWMGMISSTISVVADLGKVTAADLAPPDPSRTGPAASAAPGSAAAATGSIASAFGPSSSGGGCCGTTPPAFAGGKIPTDSVRVATRVAGGQEVEVTVDGNGYTPAVLVVQKGVKTTIRFVARGLTSCNYLVDFPEYQGRLDLSQGQLQTPPLDVTTDFTFQCGMGMLHGYVKVVDDISAVDLPAVRRQVAAFKPAQTAAGCCGK